MTNIHIALKKLEDKRKAIEKAATEKIEAEFRADLQALLNKYGANLEAEDHWQGYAECGEDIRITAEIDGVYTKDGELVRPYVSIDLGRYIAAKK